MKRIRIFFEYLAATLIIFLLLSAIGSVIIIKFYGDELQESTMQLLNEQLDTRISYKEIGINTFKSFPNTSIYLNELIVWSGHQFNREEFLSVNPDTLIAIEKAYFEFNLIHLLRKKINIRSVKIQGGDLRFLVDSEGRGNYKILGTQSGNENEIGFELKNVQLKDISYAYINNSKKVQTLGTLSTINLSGNLNKQNFQLQVKGNSHINTLENHGVSYLENENMDLSLSISVAENLYKISNGKIKMGQLAADIRGEFRSDPETGIETDLHLHADNVDFSRINDLLEKTRKSIPGLDAEGFLSINAAISGVFSSTQNPHIKAQFHTSGSSASLHKLPFSFSNISLDGSFSNGNQNNPVSSSIALNSFSANFAESRITGTFNISNLVQPKMRAFLQGEISCAPFQKYFPDLPLEVSSGNIAPVLEIIASVDRQSAGKSILSLSSTGSLKISDLNAQFQDMNIAGLNGDIKLKEEDIISSLSGSIESVPFSSNFSGVNFLAQEHVAPYLIEGTLDAGEINIDSFLASIKKEDRDPAKKSTLPENIALKIAFSIDKIIKDDVETKGLKGTLRYSFPTLVIDPLHLETMSGSIHSDLVISDLDEDNSHMSLTSAIENVDINDLFRSFNNFGQSFLTANNIHGSVSGKSELYTRLGEDFLPLPKSIISENNIQINNGELNNFEPVMEMSKFLKTDNLDAIKFSAINNTILIKDGIITIPEMDIRSSAMNLRASGEHRLDKTYNYHLATKLSEYLFNKAKSSRNREFDIALDTEDERTVFLILYDEGSGVKIEYDEDQVMKKIRNDIREERQELKELFNEEFGLFKKDSSLKKEGTDKKPTILQFEFEDDAKRDSTIQKPGRKGKWWKKRRLEDKKPKFEFVIDEDK